MFGGEDVVVVMFESHFTFCSGFKDSDVDFVCEVQWGVLVFGVLREQCVGNGVGDHVYLGSGACELPVLVWAFGPALALEVLPGPC